MIHGVILPHLFRLYQCRSERKLHDSPVSDGKTHRVANEDDSHHGLAAQFSVRIDTVTDGKLDSDGVGETDDAHGENQAEPLHVVRGSDAPEDQAPRNEKYRWTEEPKTVLGLHYASVSSC